MTSLGSPHARPTAAAHTCGGPNGIELPICVLTQAIVPLSCRYTNSSVLPAPGNMDELAGGVTYRYIEDPAHVVYPFGYGLSYTTFKYATKGP